MNRASRSIKKLNIFCLLLALLTAVLALGGCDKSPNRNDYEPNTVYPSEYDGFAENRKIYVTSIGQSVEMIQLMLNLDTFQGVEYVEDSVLEANAVEEGAVVFAVVGCSIKSLAENGLTKEDELHRAKKFVSLSQSGKFGLVCWHIGGMSRRGSSSDSLIEYLFGNCDLALFKAEGNYDLKLSDWAMAGGVPYCQYDSAMTGILRSLLGVADV